MRAAETPAICADGYDERGEHGEWRIRQGQMMKLGIIIQVYNPISYIREAQAGAGGGGGRR